MKIDANKFAFIKSTAEYLGSNISVCLPQIHALTGSDTTSYLFNVSKIEVLKCVKENTNSLLYIKNLGNSIVLEGVQKVRFSGLFSAYVMTEKRRID